jgi:23S rRNA pseudouridine1911/1915/1917 synthase
MPRKAPSEASFEKFEEQAQNEFDKNYPPYIEHTYTFTITAGQAPERVDAYLTNVIPNATRTKVQDAIAAEAVLLNGQPVKPSRKVQHGDVLTVHVMRPPPMELVPENIPLDILYEDATVLVVNKAAGMVTHPGFGNRYGTLVNAVLWHLGVREALPIDALEDDGEDEGEEDDENDEDKNLMPATDEGRLYASDAVRPGIVHRLDKDTSGVLVISKDPAAHHRLARQFAERTAKREYYALVWGVVQDDAGTIDAPLGRSPRDRKIFAVVQKGGKQAITDYRVLERFEHCTLLALRLRTGRTHQIRVHCAHIKHPLFGDAQYGGGAVVVGGEQPAFKQQAQKLLRIMPRQALHARMLGFIHPASGKWMEFETPLPQDFQTVLDTLRRE